jgi:hypothetical protein
MRTFAEYRNQRDFGCTVEIEADAWLVVPIGHNRDSDTLSESNWAYVLCALESYPSGEASEEDSQWHVLNFNHWACGWVDCLIVRPDSDALYCIDGILARLESYPALDDEDFSNREHENAIAYLAGEVYSLGNESVTRENADTIASEVLNWFGDNNQRAHEHSLMDNSSADEADIRDALIALGYGDSDA